MSFDRSNAINVTYLGDSISELILPEAAIPTLEATLIPFPSVEIFKNFDPTTPLSPSTTPEKARELFQNRIDGTINRLKTSAPKSRRIMTLTAYLEAYRNTGRNTHSITLDDRKEYIRGLLRASLWTNQAVPPNPVAPTEEQSARPVSDMETDPVRSEPVQGTDQ